jgi:hypothetical protein
MTPTTWANALPDWSRGRSQTGEDASKAVHVWFLRSCVAGIRQCRGQVGALAIATAHKRNEKRGTKQDQSDPGEGPAQIHGAMFAEFHLGTLSTNMEQAYEGHET